MTAALPLPFDTMEQAPLILRRGLRVLTKVARGARRDNVARGMRPAFADRDDMVLGQLLRACPAVRASVAIGSLDRRPLSSGQIAAIAHLPGSSPRLNLAHRFRVLALQGIGSCIDPRAMLLGVSGYHLAQLLGMTLTPHTSVAAHLLGMLARPARFVPSPLLRIFGELRALVSVDAGLAPSLSPIARTAVTPSELGERLCRAASRASLVRCRGILRVHSLTSIIGRGCHAPDGCRRAGASLCANYTIPTANFGGSR